MADGRIKLFSDLDDKVIRNHAKAGDRIFIDMDDTLVDHSVIMGKVQNGDIEREGASPSFILKLSVPHKGCVEVVKKLSKKYDLYVLTGSHFPRPGEPFNGMDWKYDWLRKYFGPDNSNIFYNKVIFCTRKELLIPSGAYLIDNRLGTKNGQDQWNKKNKLIHFGNSQFPNWEAIGKFLL